MSMDQIAELCPTHLFSQPDNTVDIIGQKIAVSPKLGENAMHRNVTQITPKVSLGPVCLVGIDSQEISTMYSYYWGQS